MGGDGGRRPWHGGPTPREGGWLSLSDDEILFRLSELPADHGEDDHIMEVVRSDRHFFVRQEAAKRLQDGHRLKDHSGDRHLGQILVRSMTRREDVAYLEKLIQESRHVEVKKAAEAQLRLIAARENKA